jgi:bleomycin hydrolase
MPETVSSSETGPLNRDLSTVLRQAGRDLRAQAAQGASEDELAQVKAETLAVVHRMLSLHLGSPPERFWWQWRDGDKGFHRDGLLTPLEFAARYVTIPLDDYVCVVHDPRPSSPMGRVFTVECLGNVVGAPPVTYLNVDIALIKQLAMDSIVNGEPVWFGCDVGQMYDPEQGTWDATLYDYDSLYRHATDLDKADRLLHQGSAMTHAMLLTGVDVVDGAPRRWRVENSWGEEKADKGFWTMNDTWFAEHVFETAVRRDALPATLRDQLDTEPIVLPAWDPMGALAR